MLQPLMIDVAVRQVVCDGSEDSAGRLDAAVPLSVLGQRDSAPVERRVWGRYRL